jgi:hypothetical protein
VTSRRENTRGAGFDFGRGEGDVAGGAGAVGGEEVFGSGGVFEMDEQGGEYFVGFGDAYARAVAGGLLIPFRDCFCGVRRTDILRLARVWRLD